MKLSNQAMGTLMILLQKSLMEQSDIVPPLRMLDFDDNDGMLIVTNPPNMIEATNMSLQLQQEEMAHSCECGIEKKCDSCECDPTEE